MSHKQEKEIERKFLCKTLPKKQEQYHKIKMKQGYIAKENRTTVRIRQESKNCKLTVKSGKGISRNETEIDLSQEDFNRLWPFTQDKRIEKTRYYIPLESGHTAELDIYHNPELKGFISLEVEFSSINDAKSFTPPPWFGEEVSNNPDYLNSNLAEKGLPEYH